MFESIGIPPFLQTTRSSSRDGVRRFSESKMSKQSHRTPSYQRHLFCALALSVGAIEASSDFHNNNNYNNNHHHLDPSQPRAFLYDEIQSIDFDIVYEDGDSSNLDESRPRTPLNTQDEQQEYAASTVPSFDVSVTDFETDHSETPSSEVTIVESSLLYDGDCYVSSEAMMCHGGGGADNYLMDRFEELLEFYGEDATDDEDDDDEDDNDGHSSMLSNASLRRSRSTRRVQNRNYSRDNGNPSTKHEHKSYTNKVVRLRNLRKLQLQNEGVTRQKLSKPAFL